MKRNNKILLIVILIVNCTSGLFAQDSLKVKEDYTPYDLLSSYYNENFKPFHGGNGYVGLAFNLKDKQYENTQRLLDKVVEGGSLDYDLNFKGGYYTGNYGMIGLNYGIYQSKFTGKVLRDSDTVQTNSITRGMAFTPNVRTSVPLTANERLSFFTEVGLGFGFSNTVIRDVKNLDEINKKFVESYSFAIGISPGVTFFAMENFAFEVQLNILGYNLKVNNITVNGVEGSRDVTQNVNFQINLLTLDLGLAYYFGAKKH